MDSLGVDVQGSTYQSPSEGKYALRETPVFHVETETGNQLKYGARSCSRLRFGMSG